MDQPENENLISVKNRWALLFVLAIFAIGLRWFHLDYQSLWVDEIASMNGADPELSIASVLQYSVMDQPPSFFLLLHGWLKIFPFTDISGRWLAAILGLAGIFMIYFLGKELRSDRVGLIASSITTFSFIHIYFSQEVRFYTLVFFAATGSFLFFIKAIRTERVIHFAVYVLFTALLIYTHYYGLVVLASQGIIFFLVFLIHKRTVKFFFTGFCVAVLIIIIISPWIPVFFSDIKTQQFWIPAEPFYFPVKYFYVYFKDVISCIVFGSLLIYYLWRLWSNYRVQRIIPVSDGILVGATILGYLIPTVYSLVQTPMLQERYTMVVLPNVIVMISIGVADLPRRYGFTVVGVTCLTSVMSLVFVEKFYTTPRKEDWRGMVDLVIRESTHTQPIVSRHAWYCNYYFKSRGDNRRAWLPADLPPSLHADSLWYLDGFDLPLEPSPIENSWAAQGYVRVRTDSLYRARASLYVFRKRN